MAFHGRVVPGDGVHTPFAWLFANQAAREAFTPTSGVPALAADLVLADINRVALQVDNGSLWRLTDHDPVTWAAVAVVDVMTGDAGSGGAVGLVPAPGAGYAAAGRVLLADGTWGWPEETFVVALGNETTAIETGTANVKFRAPYACTLKRAKASLTTASSSGVPTFDINEAGATLLSTKLTVPENATTSVGGTPAVISDSAIADDAELTFDVDAAGTGAAGAKVYITIQRTA